MARRCRWPTWTTHAWSYGGSRTGAHTSSLRRRQTSSLDVTRRIPAISNFNADLLVGKNNTRRSRRLDNEGYLSCQPGWSASSSRRCDSTSDSTSGACWASHWHRQWGHATSRSTTAEYTTTCDSADWRSGSSVAGLSNAALQDSIPGSPPQPPHNPPPPSPSPSSSAVTAYGSRQIRWFATRPRWSPHASMTHGPPPPPSPPPAGLACSARSMLPLWWPVAGGVFPPSGEIVPLSMPPPPSSPPVQPVIQTLDRRWACCSPEIVAQPVYPLVQIVPVPVAGEASVFTWGCCCSSSEASSSTWPAVSAIGSQLHGYSLPCSLNHCLHRPVHLQHYHRKTRPGSSSWRQIWQKAAARRWWGARDWSTQSSSRTSSFTSWRQAVTSSIATQREAISQ